MRERLVTLALAVAALIAFYVLWLSPAPAFDPDAEAARPTTAERRGNGYAALYEWLARAAVPVRSFRERYTALPDLDLPATGNLLVLSLPGIDVFHNDEFGALDKWVRRGNTLLINAALIDQPGWAAGRESGTVVEIESLTSLEFETKEAREARLDDTPLAQRVHEADERAAKKGDDDEEDEESTDEDGNAVPKSFDVPERIALTATGPHALLAGVKTLGLETDYQADDWSLRLPYDNFVLTLARGANGEGAMFEQRLGKGRILLVAGGSTFTNRALGNDDNARLFSNIVAASVRPGGAVLFDDLRQGLSASYDPARFYKDSRLYRTLLIVLAAWLVWVLGSTRLRAPAIVRHDPSEAELVRRTGDLIARTVAPHRLALRLFDQFFAALPRAARDGGAAGVAGGTSAGVAAVGAANDADFTDPAVAAGAWHWLERHAALLPQERDQLAGWYAAARAGQALPLVRLKLLLDSLEKRLNT
ncbi:MAG TPA: DUF4350 domain-containing protein [Steroidobacteraceae bacterium]|nr:DUF4350 domain-containing protein [Steroidobacteraceae bacterium]